MKYKDLFNSDIPKPIRYLDLKQIDSIVKQPSKWMEESISHDFSHYANFDKQRVLDTFNRDEKVTKDNIFVLYEVKDKQVIVTKKNDNVNSCNQGAITLYQEVLSYLAKNNYIKDLIFILRLRDFTDLKEEQISLNELGPLLAVTRDNQHSIDKGAVLIPDYMNLETWPKQIKQIDKANKRSPWEKKTPIVFWRGGDADVSGFRHDAVKLSHSMKHKHLDIQFSHGENATSSFVRQADHVKYKYQLTIDGHTSAWERPVWQLYSNSVLLKQRSDLVQWYYSAIQPGVHYVDIGHEPQNMLFLINSFGDKRLKEIAENGHQFAKKELSTEAMMAYLILVLQKYEALQHA